MSFLRESQPEETRADRGWDSRFVMDSIPEYNALNDRYCKFWKKKNLKAQRSYHQQGGGGGGPNSDWASLTMGASPHSAAGFGAGGERPPLRGPMVAFGSQGLPRGGTGMSPLGMGGDPSSVVPAGMVSAEMLSRTVPADPSRHRLSVGSAGGGGSIAGDRAMLPPEPIGQPYPPQMLTANDLRRPQRMARHGGVNQPQPAAAAADAVGAAAAAASVPTAAQIQQQQAQMGSRDLQEMMDRRTLSVHVEKAIEVREGFLYLLQELTERCQAQAAVDREQAAKELLHVVGSLRSATLDCVEAAGRWEAASGQPYTWKGVPYLTKVQTDLSFFAHSKAAQLLDFSVVNNPLLVRDGGSGGGGGGGGGGRQSGVLPPVAGKGKDPHTGISKNDPLGERMANAEKVLKAAAAAEADTADEVEEDGYLAVLEEEQRLLQLQQHQHQQVGGGGGGVGGPGDNFEVQEEDWLTRTEDRTKEVENAAAVDIQRMYRGFRARRRVKGAARRRAAALRLQKFARRIRARNAVAHARRRRDGATTLQALQRGVQGRQRVRHLRLEKHASTEIQRVFRGYVGRKLANAAETERYAATQVQKTWRGYSSRRRLAARRCATQSGAAVRIQKAWRGFATRSDSRYSRHKLVAAIRLQAWARGIVARRIAEQRRARRDATVRIQAFLRGCAARAEVSRLAVAREENATGVVYRTIDRSAAAIQAAWRGHRTRQEYARRRAEDQESVSADVLAAQQARLRGQLESQIVSKDTRDKAALKIQGQVRMRTARKRVAMVKALHGEAVKIQKVYRGRRGRLRARAEAQQEGRLSASAPAEFDFVACLDEKEANDRRLHEEAVERMERAEEEEAAAAVAAAAAAAAAAEHKAVAAAAAAAVKAAAAAEAAAAGGPPAADEGFATAGGLLETCESMFMVTPLEESERSAAPEDSALESLRWPKQAATEADEAAPAVQGASCEEPTAAAAPATHRRSTFSLLIHAAAEGQATGVLGLLGEAADEVEKLSAADDAGSQQNMHDVSDGSAASPDAASFSASPVVAMRADDDDDDDDDTAAAVPAAAASPELQPVEQERSAAVVEPDLPDLPEPASDAAVAAATTAAAPRALLGDPSPAQRSFRCHRARATRRCRTEAARAEDRRASAAARAQEHAAAQGALAGFHRMLRARRGAAELRERGAARVRDEVEQAALQERRRAARMLQRWAARMEAARAVRARRRASACAAEACAGVEGTQEALYAAELLQRVGRARQGRAAVAAAAAPPHVAVTRRLSVRFSETLTIIKYSAVSPSLSPRACGSEDAGSAAVIQRGWRAAAARGRRASLAKRGQRARASLCVEAEVLERDHAQTTIGRQARGRQGRVRALRAAEARDNAGLWAARHASEQEEAYAAALVQRVARGWRGRRSVVEKAKGGGGATTPASSPSSAPGEALDVLVAAAGGGDGCPNIRLLALPVDDEDIARVRQMLAEARAQEAEAEAEEEEQAAVAPAPSEAPAQEETASHGTPLWNWPARESTAAEEQLRSAFPEADPQETSESATPRPAPPPVEDEAKDAASPPRTPPAASAEGETSAAAVPPPPPPPPAQDDGVAAGGSGSAAELQAEVERLVEERTREKMREMEAMLQTMQDRLSAMESSNASSVQRASLSSTLLPALSILAQAEDDAALEDDAWINDSPHTNTDAIASHGSILRKTGRKNEGATPTSRPRIVEEPEPAPAPPAPQQEAAAEVGSVAGGGGGGGGEAQAAEEGASVPLSEAEAQSLDANLARAKEADASRAQAEQQRLDDRSQASAAILEEQERRRDAAAVAIQCWQRQLQARTAAAARRANVAAEAAAEAREYEEEQVQSSAVRIQRGWLVKAERLQGARIRAVTRIQAYLRGRHGRTRSAARKREVEARKEAELRAGREAAAAAALQRAGRGAAARAAAAALRGAAAAAGQVPAAETVQRAVRCRQARAEAGRRRSQQEARTAVAAVKASHERAAARIQRAWLCYNARFEAGWRRKKLAEKGVVQHNSATAIQCQWRSRAARKEVHGRRAVQEEAKTQTLLAEKQRERAEVSDEDRSRCEEASREEALRLFRAAAVVQRCYKCYNARFMLGWKRAARTGRRTADRGAEEDALNKEAATRIQCMYRAWAARRLRRVREESRRGVVLVKRSEEERLEEAATKIQCAYRCFNARFEAAWRRERKQVFSAAEAALRQNEVKALQAEMAAAESELVGQQQRVNAALAIQCAWRCYCARFYSAWMLNEKRQRELEGKERHARAKAALVIQVRSTNTLDTLVRKHTHTPPHRNGRAASKPCRSASAARSSATCSGSSTSAGQSTRRCRRSATPPSSCSASCAAPLPAASSRKRER